MLVDTHAHLDFINNPKEWVKNAQSDGVSKLICVGTSVDASRKCAAIAEKYSRPLKRHSHGSGNLETGFSINPRMTEHNDLQIFASAGIHAQDGKDDIEKYGSLEQCIKILKQVRNDAGRVVAIGECGFDIKFTTDNQQLTTDKEIEFQKELFEAQINLAAELNLPLIVHCRNAWEETFDLLSNVNGQLSNIDGVFHSFTGDWQAAKQTLDLGFYISFSGIVTFKNAPHVAQTAQKIPLERMLLETDSPFLAPEPIRGSPNEPKNVKIIASFIASLRNVPIVEIAEATSRNAETVFKLKDNF